MPDDFRFYWEKDRKGKGKGAAAKPGNSGVMHISVPGYAKDEIFVKLSGSSLRINARKRRHRTEKGAGFVREEAVSHSFSKFVSLPNRVNPADFDVAITDGEITLKRKKKTVEKKH